MTTTKPAYMVLEDGSTYRGSGFGADVEAHGEVVFNTSMTGYQEMLTDPSYAGQIVMPTYPLIGNYGINETDFESRRIQVSGFVVREHSLRPSHNDSTMTLHEFLAAQGIPGIYGVDTRAITRHLRTRGVMMGTIAVDEAPEAALTRLRELPSYGDLDYVSQVTTRRAYTWDEESLSQPSSDSQRRVLISDFGVKYNIMRILTAAGCEVVAIPAGATAEQILERNPDGVVLSPGPGDPELLDYTVETARGLLGRVPMLGICLGHQVLGRALGASTFKLKFGHRGGNHPVRDEETGRIYITAQNHGYAVDPDGLPAEVRVSHVNLNDGTVEGLKHTGLPVMSIQYHSEASPGPLDNRYIFDRFLVMVNNHLKTKGGSSHPPARKGF